LEVFMKDVASALAPIEVTTTRGKRLRLETLWREKTAVLVFIRHFG
jgi:hypothetical protein